MIRRPPLSTRTDTLFPYTALFRSASRRRHRRTRPTTGVVMTRRPLSTYRLQIRRSFDLDAAAGVTGYLRDLGVSWAYLSPLLRATPGSDHGYDVVDVGVVDPERGGAAGFRSEERRVGKECVSTWRSRWSPYH